MIKILIYAATSLAMTTGAMASDTIFIVEGETPLHLAAKSGTQETIVALLDAGADVNAQTELGETPLHFAAKSNYRPLENIVVLLNTGADGSLKNGDGKTAFDVAKDNGKVKGTDAYWQLNDAQYK